jgi:hypothetical protein
VSPIDRAEPGIRIAINDWKPRMQQTVRHLAGQLVGIRTGTVSLGFIET